ncbi:hypothetical protein VTK26DRAFT_2240 [Humicola hyalothermophila]
MPDLGPDPPDLHPTHILDNLNNAIASLSPALEILEGFHHRNKNQHRLSKWWAQADMLRRHVRKMLRELEDGIVEAERLERVRQRGLKAGKVKAKSKSVDGKRDGKGDGEGEGNVVVTRRAEYLRWKLGPGAFLAFTQLSADRQFAHLGLMLLGVLAQVDKALAPFAPPPDETAEVAGQVNRGRPQTSKPGSSSITSPKDWPTQPDHATDMGEAVSREDMDRLHTSIETEEQQEQKETPHIAAPELQAAERARETTQKRKTPSTQTPVLKAGETRVPGLEDAETKPKKKKKKKIGGDEFDAIFGSFESKSTKQKKQKKRKKGDEFDDIFGSLL